MSLALRLALRDLRGGLTGLRLLAICLFLGVAALAGVGSLSSAIVAGLNERGQAILGGDVQVSMSQRDASAEELAVFRAAGRVSHVTRMRAMASRLDGNETILVELKGVDQAYPLYGNLRLEPGALASRPSANQVAIGPELADRLAVRIGDDIRIGAATLRIIGFIAEEPDRVGQGFALGSTALVDRTGLAATGLVQPGSLYTSAYRLRLPAGTAPDAVTERFKTRFKDAGFQVQDRSDGAPGTRRFIERLGQFLTLVGLAALVIAGIGVGNGVTSYLDSKSGTIATLKLLGATSRTIFTSYLLQILIVASGALAAGLVAGAVIPSAVTWIAGAALPVPPRLALYPTPLLVSFCYGLLIAFVFAILPLARARAVPAGSLFRGSLESLPRPSWQWIALASLAAAAIAALAVTTSRDPGFAAIFIAAALGLLLLLSMIGWLIRAGAARLPRPASPLLRLALANLHRPGAQTGRLVVALGLGLTLFTTLAVIETNLSGQIRTTVPDRAPSFFMLDIPVAEVPRFRELARRSAPAGELVTIPALRGTVVAVGDRRVSEMRELPEGAWFLRGDRGLTYARDLPEGSRIVAGHWWAPDYRGPPLVSLDAEAARAVGLGVGDRMTISILGREIEARIGSLREIDWDTLGFNFIIVFAPGTLEQSPHSFTATISMPQDQERVFARTISKAFPSVSMIRVKEVVETVAGMFEQLSVAVRSAASVAILAGIAVLIGALAASRRARIYDSVILKLLGATRARILAAQALEFGALALILATVAFLLGAASGWYVVVEVLELEWAPDWGVVLAVLVSGAIVTLLLGLLGSLSALSARPAQALRNL
ncbi:ABC transporter permease [Sphingosinicella rhizophila]|uniref:FtsX-like permease family protein n=1 Tax=Sphingosinicella rhizophila TaxID=3050082 RepID=A0ABU3Q7H8_9SPHN|nr:FtsX-like permease family protein [Sphingosinicella sp. GR2756]MDT9599351.1 FtsX-like permease family protein [Sphingosinicella sp. GR2756]